MSTADDEKMIRLTTRMMQIIGGSLVAGVVIFLGIVIALFPARVGLIARPAVAGANPPQIPALGAMDFADIVTWSAVVFAAIGLPLSIVLPRQIATGIRRKIAGGNWTQPSLPTGEPAPFSPEALQSDTGKLAFVYQTQFIIGAAIIEGLAFFAATAYMLVKSPIALTLALLLTGALILRFPTYNRVASWIERQRELLAEDRQSPS